MDKENEKLFKGGKVMKIKIEIGDKTIIEISWMHIIFFGICLFIGFICFVSYVLNL